MRSIADIEFFDEQQGTPKFGTWTPAFKSTRWCFVGTMDVSGRERDVWVAMYEKGSHGPATRHPYDVTCCMNPPDDQPKGHGNFTGSQPATKHEAAALAKAIERGWVDKP